MTTETLASTRAKVKKFMGIHQSITVYDDELDHWIEECESTLINTAGIPSALIEDDQGVMDKRAFTCILWYVKANFGNDRTGLRCSSRAMYQHKLRELQTEEGGVWDPESEG